jgi:hypothetical protein
MVRGADDVRYIRFRAFAPDDLPRLRSLLAEHVGSEPR